MLPNYSSSECVKRLKYIRSGLHGQQDIILMMIDNSFMRQTRDTILEFQNWYIHVVIFLI